MDRLLQHLASNSLYTGCPKHVLDDETLQQPIQSLLITSLNALYKSQHLPILLISNYQYPLKHTSGMCALCNAPKKMLKKLISDDSNNCYDFEVRMNIMAS